MENIYVEEIIQAVNGEKNDYVKENFVINNISTDSRKNIEASLFIPIIGERFDAHDFIEDAFNNGAKLTLSSRKDIEYPAIYVKDTKQAIMDLAEYYREKLDIKVVGITGSVGKTTTKELIDNVLKQKYKTLKTYKNFNNEIGVPLTIFELDKSYELLILELGMSHFGEMHNLSKMSRPDYVVLTNIGYSHVGNFSCKEDILNAKSEIFDFFKGSKVIINGEDELLSKLNNKYDYEFIEYGLGDKNHYRTIEYKLKGIYGNHIKVKTPKDRYDIRTKGIGNHLIYNVLPAIALGEIMGLDKDQIIQGIENYKSKDMRMELISKGNIKIINDAYNASLESMKSAIDTLVNSPSDGRKVAILGDILELGEESKKQHGEIGKYVSKFEIDLLITVGNDARFIYQEGKKNKFSDVYHYADRDKLKTELKNLILDNDLILVKGSRGSKMEEFIEFI